MHKFIVLPIGDHLIHVIGKAFKNCGNIMQVSIESLTVLLKKEEIVPIWLGYTEEEEEEDILLHNTPKYRVKAI